MTMNDEFEPWEFIADNLPGYYGRDDVALCDDLARLVDDEFDPADPHDSARRAALLEEFGDEARAALHMRYISCRLFIEAYENYMRQHHGKA